MDQEVKNILYLTDHVWDNLNVDLLMLAFEQNDVNEKQQYEKFVFSGIAVLKIIITRILFDNFVYDKNKPVNQSVLSIYRDQILNDMTLSCHVNRMEICKNTNCNELLKAIIGILYYYLNSIESNISKNINILQEWFYNNFYLEESFKYLILDQNSQYAYNCDLRPLPTTTKTRNIPIKQTRQIEQDLPPSCQSFDIKDTDITKIKIPQIDDYVKNNHLMYELTYWLEDDTYKGVMYFKYYLDKQYKPLLCASSKKLNYLLAYFKSQGIKALTSLKK